MTTFVSSYCETWNVNFNYTWSSNIFNVRYKYICLFNTAMILHQIMDRHLNKPAYEVSQLSIYSKLIASSLRVGLLSDRYSLIFRVISLQKQNTLECNNKFHLFYLNKNVSEMRANFNFFFKYFLSTNRYGYLNFLTFPKKKNYFLSV